MIDPAESFLGRHAAYATVWTSLCSGVVAISMVPWLGRDIEKCGGHHSARRTAAMASLKVGSCLSYQAAPCARRAAVGAAASWPAQSVTSENSPSSTGGFAGWQDRTTAAGSRRRDDDGPP